MTKESTSCHGGAFLMYQLYGVIHIFIFLEIQCLGFWGNPFAGIVGKFTAFSGFFYDTFFDAEDLSFRDFGSVGAVGAGFGDFTAEKHGVGSFASVI